MVLFLLLFFVQSNLVFITTFSSVTGLGGQVSVSRLGPGEDTVADTECDTDVGNLRDNTARGVENGVVKSTSKELLFERREHVGHDTLIKKLDPSVSLLFPKIIFIHKM